MADLPLVTRWTADRKRELVARIAAGEVPLDEALRHYRISAEEFARWRTDYPVREPAR